MLADQVPQDILNRPVSWRPVGLSQATTDERVVKACLEVFSRLDLRECLPRITAPTMFLTAKGNSLMAMEGFEAWAQAVPQGKLVVLDANCQYPAAVKPAESITAMLARIESTASV